MLDDYTRRGMIIRAALRLAEQQGWRRLGLDDIAEDAGVSLRDVRGAFDCKSAILEAFAREVDQAVLEKSDPDPEQPARDRLFDVLMTRFEILAPYKAALRRIAADSRCLPGLRARLACGALRSQYWMLLAAGVRPSEGAACAKVPGLLGVYARAASVWLEDDDPGLGRTMAALDRELRRGERLLTSVEGLCAAAGRLACSLVPLRRRRSAEASGEADLAATAEQPDV